MPVVNTDEMNPKVDFYFDKAKSWQEELTQLRNIILECGLEEQLKWGCPCYLIDQRNIVLIHVFKEYCAVLFFKGALLKDAEGILIQQTEHVQAARQMRFTSTGAIKKVKNSLKEYIYEAIEVERAGLKVPMKKPSEFKIAPEFQQRLDAEPTIKKAFEALTAGRQRAYLLFFAAAKQSKTREARIEKSIPQILAGIGLNDSKG